MTRQMQGLGRMGWAARSVRIALAAAVAGGAGGAVSGCAAGEDDVGANAGGGGPIDLCGSGGTFRCDGETAIACDDDAVRIDCAAQGKTCDTNLACVSCKPGAGTCSNGTATVCRPDGTEYETYQCDAAQGMTCQPDGCKGACSWSELGASYLGCDYYPTVTLNNGIWGGFEFAVALSNVGHSAANVIVTRGTEQLAQLTVEPGALQVVKLPWVSELKGPDPNFMGQPQPPGPSRKVGAGAYRVRSDQPIAAYQFNPLEYHLDPAPAECPLNDDDDGCYSYSNDASLLLPAHMLRRKYAVVTWPDLGCKPGFFTITATMDDTEIHLDPRGEIASGGGFDSSGQGFAVLNQGDVLQVLGVPQGGPFCFQVPGTDLTNTFIEASKPVQVIAGHGCANVPAPETQACDHMEEVVFPLETLGKEYVVAMPVPPNGQVTPETSHTIRIAAVAKNTLIEFEPPVSEPITLSPQDDPLELRYVRQNVRVKANRPLVVAQFMHGTDANGDESISGDPAQSMAVPTGQFRNTYTFLAPDNYVMSYVDVIAKVGTVVRIDGQATAISDPVGTSGYAVAHVPLGPGSVHQAESEAPSGINVYGYGDWTSYMYPGGLNLGTISPIVQ